MAGRVIDATLRFVDRFTAPMSRAMTTLQRNSRQYQRVGRDIQKTGREISRAGSALTKGVTAPVVAIGAAAIKTGIEFESAFAGVEKTFNSTGLNENQISKELDRINNGLKEMSENKPMTYEALAAIAENAQQLGIAREDVLSFTAVIADLGVSTNLVSNEAASSLAKFANVTKMNPDDYGKLGATIVDLGNNFATTEADIVAMATRLSGAGSQIGLSESEIMGFATALSSVGIEAEMGGSAFSKAMIKMKVASATGLTRVQELSKKTGMSLRDMQLMSDNDSKGFKELAQSLGMTKTEMNNIVKSGVELQHFSNIAGVTTKQFKELYDANPGKAIDAFIKGLGDTETKGKSSIEMLQDMGFTEVRLRDTLLRLSNSQDGVYRAMEMGNKAWEEETALNNEANKRYATTESQLLMLKNAFRNVGADISVILLPPLIALEKKLKTAVDAFNNLDEGTKKTIVKFAGIAAAVGPSLFVFGKATTGVGKLVEGIGKFGPKSIIFKQRAVAAFGIFKTIKIAPPAGLLKIFSLFGSLGGKLLIPFRSLGLIGPLIGRLAGKLTFLSGPLSFVGSYFQIFGVLAGKLFSPFLKLGGIFGTVGKSIFTLLGPTGTVVAVLAAIVIAGILVYKNWDKMKKAAKQLGETIKSIFLSSGINIDKFKGKIGNLILGVKQLVSNFKSSGSGVIKAWQPVLDFIGKIFVGGIKIYFSAIVGFVSGLLSSIVDIAGGIIKIFNGIIDFVGGIFTGNWKKAWKGVKEIFGGIFETLAGVVKAPMNVICGIINSVIGAINKLNIKIPDWSPWKPGETFGLDIPKLPMLYKGTNNWAGGPAMIHDRGAEIVDLPSGSRVYPHDKSMQIARAEGKKESSIKIAKLADQIIVREDADIDKIVDKLAKKLMEIQNNSGGGGNEVLA